LGASWSRASDGPGYFWGQTAFATSIGKLVVFGGTTGFVANSDVHLFDPAKNTWSTVKAVRGWPTTRDLGASAYDPDRGRIVMFGGRRYADVLRDTWAFDPKTSRWTSLVSNCRKVDCPPARLAGAMVWSSALHKLVLFGGSTDSDLTAFNDTWTFDTAWKSLPTTGAKPSARFLFGLAEDPVSGLILLYGGSNPGIVGLNDTWLLDPRTGTWTQATTGTPGPPAYGEVAMGWSPSLNAVVMTGGSDARGLTVANPGLWTFSRTDRTWVQVATSGGTPSPRKDASLTADPVHGLAILFGGEDGPLPVAYTDRTWLLK
jgi:hypothetical protein